MKSLKNRYENILADLIYDNLYYISNSPYPDEVLTVLKLKSMRIAKRLTQQQVASHMGNHQANICRFENVRYHGRNMKTIEEYARAIGCRITIDITVEGTP